MAAAKKRTKKPIGERLENRVLALDEGAVRKLLEEPGAREACASHPLLSHAVSQQDVDESKRLAVVRLLLDAGADPTPAMSWVAQNRAPEELQIAILAELIERGGDLDARIRRRESEIFASTVLGQAVVRRRLALIEAVLARGVCDVTRREALLEAIWQVGESHDPTTPRALALQLLTGVESVGECGEAGLAPLHFAALACDAELVRAILARSTPNVSSKAEVRVRMRDAMPPGEFVVPTHVIRAGSTPLDVALSVQQLLEIRDRAPEPKPNEQDLRKRRRKLAALEQITTALGDAGARPGDLAPARPQAAFKAKIDAALLELCRLAGGDGATARRVLDGLDASEIGPWSYVSRSLAALKSVADFRRVSRPTSVLARIAAEQAFDGPFPVTDRDELDDESSNYLVDIDAYPVESRAALKEGLIISARGADLFFVAPRKGGVPYVCHAHPQKFSVLADSVPEFVRREVEQLGK